MNVRSNTSFLNTSHNIRTNNLTNEYQKDNKIKSNKYIYIVLTIKTI
jgi:hypothetical protein